MKRMYIILLFVILFLLITPVALAKDAAVSALPAASPSPTPTPASSPASSPDSSSPSPSSNILSKNAKGPDVISMQLRLKELGYFVNKVTGTYGNVTANAVMAFQTANSLSADGSLGPQSADVLYSNDCKRKGLALATITVGPAQKPDRKFGDKLDWSEIDKLIPVGTTFTVVDFNTSTEFQMKRTGGKNHADVESATNADNQTFLKMFGNAFTWEKRPVLVKIENKVYAASLFGYPHGQDTIPDNGMSGSTDLYFPGSLSDISNLSDAEHNAKINRAAGDE